MKITASSHPITTAVEKALPARKKEFKQKLICSYLSCGKSFTRRARLNEHEHLHNGTQPHRCSHAGCKKAFAARYTLLIHERIHSKLRLFVCTYPDCSKAFTTNGNMQDHERRHTMDK